jgi:hypothetical protein
MFVQRNFSVIEAANAVRTRASVPCPNLIWRSCSSTYGQKAMKKSELDLALPFEESNEEDMVMSG